MARAFLLLVVAAFVPLCGCQAPARPIADLADDYVRLVLAVGAHDPGYVDTFYGPPGWQHEATTARRELPDLREAATRLLAALSADRSAPDEHDRRTFLTLQTTALRFHVDQLSGKRHRFDAEARQLFGFTPLEIREGDLTPVLAALEERLPGSGPIAAQLDAFSRATSVPPDRVPALVQASLAACRSRTLALVTLPDGEAVTIEYVRDRPWSAYAHYEGRFRTRIEVNVDVPRRPDQILDLMCHEAYPGHHTQLSLVESRLVQARGWREHQILPLLSPASALSEGAATAGVDLIFSSDARLTFTRDTLFPMAGLPVDRAAAGEAVRAATTVLAAAGTEGVRRYLDGRLTRGEAVLWLERYAAMPRPAELLAFADRFRTYVVGYTEAANRVAAYAGGDWQRFESLITEVTGPARLAQAAATEYRSSTAPLRIDTTPGP